MSRTPCATPPVNPLGQNSGNPLMLPPDHPYTRQRLKESSGNQGHTRKGPSIELSSYGDGGLSQGKRTRSSRNLISLLDREKARPRKNTSTTMEGQKVKKSKSATSLSAIFSRPASSKGKKDDDTSMERDKENQTPPETPIWAQFATQGMAEAPSTTKIPLNDGKAMRGEMDLYTPQIYSPSKQKIYPANEQPTLSRRSQPKPRPKSECLSGQGAQSSFSDTILRLRHSRQPQKQDGVDDVIDQKPALDTQKHTTNRRNGGIPPSTDLREATMNRRGSRVMAAVAAFNGKSKEIPKEPIKQNAPLPLDPRAIENAFETLLDARNVPQITRDKMRSLDTSIKADFIKQDRMGTGSASSAESLTMQSSRPSTGKRSQTEDGLALCNEKSVDSSRQAESPQKSRPRSRTFTFSKGEGEGSPAKKQKPGRPVSHHRSKSGDLRSSESSSSLGYSETTKSGSCGLFGRANVFATPEDCIGYLQQTPQPQNVEVGKIHKLRQLLRNETVEWVNKFITDGGMTGLIDLLHRIIAVEWREEHEDALLHETLSCLKALSTTSLALVNLTKIHPVLFPALVGLLYSEEKKGPSDFTTRTIIIGLLSAYLSSAPTPDIAARAQILLAYVRDPSKPEAAQLPGFITTMHHPRPYRVWQKEISDVTKEVFWIFLHQVNVIPYPDITSTSERATYLSRHFPQPHPPIPTAPYIGGVEWEATTYLTTHLDLLNGLLASLPTRNERNALRQELKDSGFEKVMGGSLRTCKEKFYGSVHAALSTWVGAAKEDGWEFKGVREGALPQTAPNSPKKASPVKKGKVEKAPKLEMPKFDFAGADAGKEGDGGWL